jgi:holin-like protein
LIRGLLQLLVFQGLGELAARFVLPMIAGPVWGLALLLAWLSLRKAVPRDMDMVAGSLMQHLSLLFVPAAVGVVMVWPHLTAHALAITTALVVSVVLTIAVGALVLKGLVREKSDGA